MYIYSLTYGYYYTTSLLFHLPWPASMSQGHEFLITLAPALPQKLQALLGIVFPHFLINTSICCFVHTHTYIYNMYNMYNYIFSRRCQHADWFVFFFALFDPISRLTQWHSPSVASSPRVDLTWNQLYTAENPILILPRFWATILKSGNGITGYYWSSKR